MRSEQGCERAAHDMELVFGFRDAFGRAEDSGFAILLEGLHEGGQPVRAHIEAASLDGMGDLGQRRRIRFPMRSADREESYRRVLEISRDYFREETVLSGFVEFLQGGQGLGIQGIEHGFILGLARSI